MPTNRRIYGLIGYPIKHSLSPAMHNAAFSALGIDAEYRLFEIAPESLNSFLNDLENKNIYGLNVTMPYKEKVLEFVTFDNKTSHLKQIGALNTIANKDGIWRGFNTDILGFQRHLKENIDPKNKKVALLGAGGVARAVSYVLAISGTSEIVVFDIERQKSQNLVNMINTLFPNFKISFVDRVEELNMRSKDLLINATPVGLKDNDLSPIAEDLLHKDLFVYDLIYNPPETKLLNLAKKIGAKFSNGIGMLLYQGMLSFEIWTGKSAPKEIMQKALLNSLRA
jgi:shikimate dehydrogenase